MARTRNEKDYLAKKREISLRAAALLSETGYEEFSINKVIQSAGLTKGAFFHYFTSKDELIDSIIQLILLPMVDEFRKIADDETIPPKEKIHRMFETGYRLKRTDTRETQQLIMLLAKPENRVMLQMITLGIASQCTDIYEQVFVEGNRKGQFHIPHPNGSAYLFMQMILALNQEIGRVLYKNNVDPLEKQNLMSKVDAFSKFAEDLLELDEGERLFDPKMLSVAIR